MESYENNNAGFSCGFTGRMRHPAMKNQLFQAYFFLMLPAFAFDLSSCKSSTDRLKRSARDAADAAESINGMVEMPGAANQVTSKLDDVESRLRRAKSDYGYKSSKDRIFPSYRGIAGFYGVARARTMCNEAIEKNLPGICRHCIGE